MGVIRASQQVRPRASAASTSGKKRTANICSCLRALLSLRTHTHTPVVGATADSISTVVTHLLKSCSSCILSSITSWHQVWALVL